MDTINSPVTIPAGINFARLLLTKPDEPSTSAQQQQTQHHPQLIPVTVSANGTATTIPATVTFVNNSSSVALVAAAAAAAAAASSSSAASNLALAGSAAAAAVGPANKKCPYHRQCYRNHHHHQQQQQQQVGGRRSTANGAGSTALYPQRDAISTNAAPPLNATILAERYLLLDIVEGSSLFRCTDLKTQEELVCKVSHILLYFTVFTVQTFNLKLEFFELILVKFE